MVGGVELMADLIVGQELLGGADGDVCIDDAPHVLTGTGELYLNDGAGELHAGNFSLVDLIQDGTAERVFIGASEVASMLGVTIGWRLQLTGDSYTNRNLERLMNLTRETTIFGEQMRMKTVRSLQLYGVRFTKDVDPVHDCAVGCRLEIELWRAYLDLPVTYTFSQDEQTVHLFNLIALPDSIQHPNEPFGIVTMTCEE